MPKNPIKKLGGSNLPSWLGKSAGTYFGSTYDYGESHRTWYRPSSFRLDGKLTDAEMIERVKDFVDYWYSWDYRVMHVPHITSSEFPAFAGQCIGLSTGIEDIGTQEGQGISTVDTIKLADVETASYDPNGNSIFLPLWAIDPDTMIEKYGEDAGLVSVALINGFVSHEFLHAQYSNIAILRDNISDAASPDNEYGRYLTAAYQLLEDFRIESKSRFSTKSFLDALSLIAFPRTEYERARQAMIDNPECIRAGMVYACCLKRSDLLAVEDKEKLLPKIARDIIHHVVRSNEYGLTRSMPGYAEEFCRAFKPPDLESKETCACTDDNCGHHSDSCEANLGEIFDGDREHRLLGHKTVRMSNFDQSVEKALNSVRKVIKIPDFHGGKMLAIPEPKTFDVLDPELQNDPYNERYGVLNGYEGVRDYLLDKTNNDDFVNSVVVDENYRFIRLLNAIRAVNNTPGQALVRGPRLINTRLTRLITDGKAFGFLDHEEDKSYRVEIVILLDRSGSQFGTETGVRTRIHMPVDLLFLQPVVAYRMVEVLKQARIPHVVLAHTSCGLTTTGERSDTPLIIKVSARGMATPDTRGETARYNQLAVVPPGNNYDGVAIEQATKYFTGRNCRKVLIVSSDGWPNGSHGYSGETAKSHTKKAIEKARRQGVNVYYLSLIEGVVIMNNELVGREYNLNAADDLEGQFKKLIADVSNISGK